MTDTAEFCLEGPDGFLATVDGERQEAWREIQHYAAMYADEGPLTIYEVTRTPVTGPGLHATEAGGASDKLQAENQHLRVLLCKVLKSLGNGAGASPECSLEFLSYIPEEVRLVVTELRALASSAATQDGTLRITGGGDDAQG